MKKVLSITLLSILLPCLGLSQENEMDFFDDLWLNPTAKTKLGTFTGQKIKGKLNGMGVYKLKSGDIYYGDVEDGIPQGEGTYISRSGKWVPHCENAKVFVGTFVNGKKIKGKCYDINSSLIYEGKFQNDAPSETYPSMSLDVDAQEFGIFVAEEDFVYTGEHLLSIPHGKGIIIYGNGQSVISDFEYGGFKGIRLTIDEDGNWQTEKTREDGETVFISSSELYNRLKQENKANSVSWLTILSETLDTITEIAEGTAEVINSINDLRNGNVSSDGTAYMASQGTFYESSVTDSHGKEDLLLIENLIREQQSSIASLESQIESRTRDLEREQKKTLRSMPSTIRIGGSWFKTGSLKNSSQTYVQTPAGLKVQKFQKDVEIASKNKVIADFKKNINWLQLYRSHNGDYIPREVWSDHLKKQEKLHKEIHQRKLETKRKTSVALRIAYESYANMLLDAYLDPAAHGMSKSEVERIQEEMKRIRDKNGITKSDFEDWNGVPKIFE